MASVASQYQCKPCSRPAMQEAAALHNLPPLTPPCQHHSAPGCDRNSHGAELALAASRRILSSCSQPTTLSPMHCPLQAHAAGPDPIQASGAGRMSRVQKACLGQGAAQRGRLLQHGHELGVPGCQGAIRPCSLQLRKQLAHGQGLDSSAAEARAPPEQGLPLPCGTCLVEVVRPKPCIWAS